MFLTTFAATMLYSRYCPGLRDTCLSYLSAAASTTIFANAVNVIGWENLILVWMGLELCGVLTVLPYRKLFGRSVKRAE